MSGRWASPELQRLNICPFHLNKEHLCLLEFNYARWLTEDVKSRPNMAVGLPKAGICQMTMNGTLKTYLLQTILPTKLFFPTNSYFRGKYTNSNLLFRATQYGRRFLQKQAFNMLEDEWNTLGVIVTHVRRKPVVKCNRQRLWGIFYAAAWGRHFTSYQLRVIVRWMLGLVSW